MQCNNIHHLILRSKGTVTANLTIFLLHRTRHISQYFHTTKRGISHIDFAKTFVEIQ